VQNNVVSVDGHSDHFCSASDNNLIQVSMPYYAVIEYIWELITVNLECLSSNVRGLMEIPEYVKKKWVLL